MRVAQRCRRQGVRYWKIMLSIILTQFATALVVAIIASALSGLNAMWSALLGGLCIVIPNSFFAAHIYLSKHRPGANPMTFFIGELVKLVATVGFMAVAIWLYRDIKPLAFICGAILVLKSYLIHLFRKKHGRS